MARLLRLHPHISLSALLATVLLIPRAGLAQFTPGDPAACINCPACGCPQRDNHRSAHIDLTESNSGQMFTGVQVRSAFGITLGLTAAYNTDDADGSRNMYTKLPGAYDTVMGYGWTHTFNDLLFTQHGGDLFRLAPDGRITRFALQTDGSYQTSPGYFETLVKNLDGSFDLTTKYQTDYHYVNVPNTPFVIGAGPILRLLSLTDRNGNVTTLTYNSTGDMTTVADTYGRTITYGYDGNHHVSSSTDPPGKNDHLWLRLVRPSAHEDHRLLTAEPPLMDTTPRTRCTAWCPGSRPGFGH